MQLIARILLAAGSLIYLTLGTAHLLFTFFTPKFRPYDPATEEAMKQTTPRLTKRTTMWDAWMGFNGSHSSGAIFFGALTFYLSIEVFILFERSLVMQGIILINTYFYLWLAIVYWFRIPLTVIILATVCYSVAVLLVHLS